MAPRLRVALDATSLLGPRTGVGQVTAGLLEALASRGDLDLRAYAITWRGRHELDDAVPAGVTAATKPFPARGTRVLWPRVPVPRIEHWTGDVDVVHATAFVAPPAHAPVLLTIHDLTYLRFPEMCTDDTRSYARLVRVALERGVTVHTYSDFVADEVREHYGLPSERVVRVYPGLATITGGDPRRGHEIAGSPRYVLALSTIEPRKNLPMLVRAFDVVAADDADLRLVVAGPPGWGIDAFDEAVRAARHAASIHRLGYVDAAARRDLLAGATVLAYPSIYEGFGHPPLEAMQCDVPVVASSAGPLPEVLGDAALLPDPTDVDSIADALRRALTDDELRGQLIARGRERVARYDWERTTREMTALYERLAARAR